MVKQWIFISPHFDDVALSAGGLVWELTRSGQTVEIWTICAGDPPYGRPLTEYAELLHGFWDIGSDVPLARSREDTACCRTLGVSDFRRFITPDNIYRYFPGGDEAVVKIPEDNQGPLEPQESYLIPPVADFLRKNVAEGWEVVIPLAVGSHRDHVLTRRAAEGLGFPLWHYADYPYLVRGEYALADWVPESAEKFSLPLSAEGIKAWKSGITCHRSQIPFLFIDEEEMDKSVAEYARSGIGNTLWKF